MSAAAAAARAALASELAGALAPDAPADALASFVTSHPNAGRRAKGDIGSSAAQVRALCLAPALCSTAAQPALQRRH